MRSRKHLMGTWCLNYEIKRWSIKLNCKVHSDRKWTLYYFYFLQYSILGISCTIFPPFTFRINGQRRHRRYAGKEQKSSLLVIKRIKQYGFVFVAKAGLLLKVYSLPCEKKWIKVWRETGSDPSIFFPPGSYRHSARSKSIYWVNGIYVNILSIELRRMAIFSVKSCLGGACITVIPHYEESKARCSVRTATGQRKHWIFAY